MNAIASKLPQHARSGCFADKTCNHQLAAFSGFAPDGSEAKTQKIYAAFVLLFSYTPQVDNLCFAFIHRQLTGCQALPDHLQHIVRLLVCFAVYHYIISIPFKRFLRMMLLHPTVKYHMQKDVGQQWTDYSSLRCSRKTVCIHSILL